MSNKWRIKAEFGGSVTVKPIPARSLETAIAILAKEIQANYVSDKRWSRGNLTIIDPNDKVRYQINEDSNENEFVHYIHLKPNKEN